MASAPSHRTELAKLCSSKDWSKAIRILDSLVSQSAAVQDICNRAFCYSQLELHKHVIKDCDRAIQLNSLHLQAYILKGHALFALGRKADALMVWEQGFELAQHQSADLKKLLELEELLVKEKQVFTNSGESSDSNDAPEILKKPSFKFTFPSEKSSEARKNKKFSVARISKTKSISVDFRLSRGIAEVNEGKYAHAISIFDQVQCCLPQKGAMGEIHQMILKKIRIMRLIELKNLSM
ncbi:unnamed protein product [Vicia faba]|uniref:Uncharacterized protein n=1 Tax=Vicia faba TaxID=3906 RepID=A0AAV1B2K5_VICFA|nr:unnamed protein product [Vicia faba]